MNSAHFPTNDLIRRRLQTSLAITSLTLSIGSTLFLLLFSNRLGLGIAATSGTMTLGLRALFGQFILFIGVLIFIVGAVLTSFIVFLMMAQRTRDFGLIKAAGCPNSLVAGYFMSELLILALLGCILGVMLGFLADFIVANAILGSYSLPNFWFAPIVFITFFILAFAFGLQPILKASRMSPIKALSHIEYYGLTVSGKHKPLSRRGITLRIAARSLARRQSASIRIVILLSVVFVLLTVSIAGGIIAKDTTTSWIQKTTASDTVAIAQRSMGNQYKLLLSTFTGVKETSNFNYTNPDLSIPDSVIQILTSSPHVKVVDSRLVTFERLKEISNFTINPETLETFPVGDSREGDSLVIGIDAQKVTGAWSIKGRFLSENGDFDAIIGDSISQSMFYPHPSRYVVLSDPLLESLSFKNSTFNIVGICVDPLNNGFVTYVPLEKLQNATGITNPNILFVSIYSGSDRTAVLEAIRSTVQTIDPGLDVFDFSEVVQQNAAFLSSTWQTILLLPILTLVSAALSLVGNMMLTVEDQRQEFAILRAIGAKPKIIINISAIQSAISLISSLAIGLSVGIIITAIILMANPLVTSMTVLFISLWLALTLIGMFFLSLWPAFRLSKTAILKIMT
ncbi:MAG: ABC transporter permease [Candidatus Bathyarchaeota archaeon]|nr:ABC transporter permease [Candidatus Bathyarchaeota archaeon]